MSHKCEECQHELEGDGGCATPCNLCSEFINLSEQEILPEFDEYLKTCGSHSFHGVELNASFNELFKVIGKTIHIKTYFKTYAHWYIKYNNHFFTIYDYKNDYYTNDKFNEEKFKDKRIDWHFGSQYHNMDESVELRNQLEESIELNRKKYEPKQLDLWGNLLHV